MSAPPPPPPPPPPAPMAPPPPPIGGGGGGGPAFLSDIRKGVGLKKVPDAMKNDRSAPIKGSSPKVSVSGGGGAVGGGAVGGGGGGTPSQADIKSKLNAMFGGGAMPQAAQPTPRAPAPPSPAFSQPHQPHVPSGPPPRGPYGAREPAPPPPATPVVGAVPVLDRSHESKPAVPTRTYKVRGQTAGLTMPAPPSCPPMNGSLSNSADPWASRFNFPDKSTFPPPPPPYTGDKTYIGHRQE
uniref:WH2 domain-containing protein n=1 Tax=Schistocephalus solidus TaxID=70667 RepID=A0A0X3Q0D8_SCHSO